MTVEIQTFGCRLNIYEAEVIRRAADSARLSNAVIINTCAVTAEAERQARQAIRKARKHNPKAEIIVTGCAAQLHPEAYAAMPEVNRVLGNEEKLKASSYDTGTATIQAADIMSIKETAHHLITSFDSHARAFVQIQQGCNHRCTFCIIPFARGNNRSVPVGEIVRQVQALVENGYTEIAFTGVDITDYGQDLPTPVSLGNLCRRVLQLVPQLQRLRLSSLDPVEIDDTLYSLFASEPRLMPHVHISLQAGDNLTLKRMKRRHLREDVEVMVERMRRHRPDVVFGADVIAGFPTETDAMFANTVSLLESCDISYLHVFPYSPRNGTPAAKMPQVPAPVRKQRAAHLRNLGQTAQQRLFNRLTGQTTAVVVEHHDSPHSSRGRTPHYAPVQFANPQQYPAGAIVPVQLEASTPTCLLGHIAS